MMTTMQWGVLIFAIFVLLTVYLISYLEHLEKKKLQKRESETLQKQQALRARLLGEGVEETTEDKQSDSQEFGTMEIRKLSQDLVEKGGFLGRRFFGNKNKAEEKQNSVALRPDASAQETEVDTLKPLVFVLYLRRQEGFLRGRDIVSALEQAGLTFGEHGIFHYKLDNKTLFSAASMVKPGSIPMENLGEFTTPGISVFMELPTHRSGRTAFVRYLLAVHTLQKLWHCQILDAKQELITPEDLEKMRQQADRYPSSKEAVTVASKKKSY